MYFILGVAAAWSVFSLMHANRDDTTEKLRHKLKRAKQEKSWLAVKLAQCGVNVPEYLSQARSRVKWYGALEEDKDTTQPTFFRRLVLAGTTVLIISGPVIAAALMR